MFIENTQDIQEVNQSSGIVFRKDPGIYTVHTDSGIVTCSASNKLRKVLVYPTADPSSRARRVDDVRDIKSTDPVAIGDRVVFTDSGDGTGMITGVYPRRNKLNRLSGKNKKLEQVLVANVDQVVVVSQASRANIYWSMLDCFLADSEALDLDCLICITKMDIADDDLMVTVDDYKRIGYPVILTSSQDGTGLDELKAALTNKVSVFVGKSGVGKSTLLNVLDPNLDLMTKDVSAATGKGKHATTHLQMYPLDFSGEPGWVVDTPGMRKFGLWKGGDLDIAWLFREMRPYIGDCRFGSDCSHTHEPGCLVKDAVSEGEITQRRYESFVKMLK